MVKKKDINLRIAKHKLDEVKRNIQYGERELEKLNKPENEETAYKYH